MSIYQAFIEPTLYDRSEFVVVVPSDLRRPRTRFVLVQFADGERCKESVSDVKTYHVAEHFVSRLVDHSRVDISLCARAAALRRLDIVLLKDAGQLLGAWTVNASSLRTLKMNNRKLAHMGVVAVNSSPDPNMLSRARQVAQEAWRKVEETVRTNTYADRSLLEARSEPPLCATASNKRAWLLINNLAELGHSSYDQADRYDRASRVLNSQYSTAKQRAAARQEKGAMVEGAIQVSGAVKKLQAELGVIVQRYKPGCFRKLFPAQFQSFLPEKVEAL